MSKIKILLLGGNGFTGKFVCKELIKRNITFRCLLRRYTDIDWFIKNKIDFTFGNIDSRNDLLKSLNGCNYLINTTSLAYINLDNLLSCCDQKNIQRYLFVSSTSIFTKLNPKSKKLRMEAEEKIKSRNINWTILRPTMIFGTPGDRNLIKIIKWISKYPFILIPGNGLALQKPVYVEDLSWAIVESILNKNTIKRIFNISGKENISFNSIINIIEDKLKKRTYKIYLSKRFCLYITQIFEFFRLNLPLKSEQIRRINEDKLFSNKDAIDLIKYSPIKFESAISKEIFLFNNIRIKNK